MELARTERNVNGARHHGTIPRADCYKRQSVHGLKHSVQRDSPNVSDSHIMPGQVVAVGHINGGPESNATRGEERMPMVLSEPRTIRVVVHDFEQLPGLCTTTPVLDCHGLKWTVQIYPKGFRQVAEGEETYVAVVLTCETCGKENREVGVLMHVTVPANGHNSFVTSSANRGAAIRILRPGMSIIGNKRFAERAAVLDPENGFLVNGNLTLEIDIRILQPQCRIWTPTDATAAKEVCSDLLKILDDADPYNADISFAVDGKDEEGGQEMFYAHRAILKTRSPTLAGLADESEHSTPVPIKDVRPSIFRMILRFIYGGEIPSKDILNTEAKVIVRAADEYGCTGLKLAAEAALASAGITTENAAEIILFADATNCAMLKEVAMDYFVENANDVMESDGFKQIEESPAILKELLKFGVGDKKRPADTSTDAGRGGDFKRMRIATLRQKLDERGLDIDGSKEMLVARLEESAET